MGYNAGKPCGYQLCSKIVPIGTQFCAKHTPKKAECDKYRGSAYERGYNARWGKISAAFIEANTFCKCGRMATAAHHIVAKADGGSDTWDNLMPVCNRCHGKYTYKERKKRGPKVYTYE